MSRRSEARLIESIGRRIGEGGDLRSFLLQLFTNYERLVRSYSVAKNSIGSSIEVCYIVLGYHGPV